MSTVMKLFPECPHCMQLGVMFYLEGSHEIKGSDEAAFFFACGNCHRGVIAHDNKERIARTYELKYENFTEIYPKPSPSVAPQFTPSDAASDFIEAQNNLKHGSIKSACLMARSAMEASMLHEGAEGRGLKNQIKDLAKKNLITTTMADWVEEIRVIGNDAAHSVDRNATLTKQDAEDAIYFAEMLFTYLYALPGQIAERRAHEETEEK